MYPIHTKLINAIEKFSVSDLISVWVIRIWCEYFKFSVSDLNLNSVWVIWIRCEWFEFDVSDLEFGVSNLNSVWVIWIRCEWFKFGVHLWATVEEGQVVCMLIFLRYLPKSGKFKEEIKLKPQEDYTCCWFNS